MRKSALYMRENECADQPRGYRAASRCFCFPYMDSIIPHLSETEIEVAFSNLLWSYSPVCVGPGRKTRRHVVFFRVAAQIECKGKVFQYDSSHCVTFWRQTVVARKNVPNWTTPT